MRIVWVFSVLSVCDPQPSVTRCADLWSVWTLTVDGFHSNSFLSRRCETLQLSGSFQEDEAVPLQFEDVKLS